MSSAPPPPPPPLQNSSGRGKFCAPRGWEQLRDMQIEPTRHPLAGVNTEGNMPNQNNPERFQGGGEPLESVHGGMGQGQMTNHIMNCNGQGLNVQRHSLGAIPDCVPQIAGYPQHEICDKPCQTEQLQEDQEGPRIQVDELARDLSGIDLSNTGNHSGQINTNQLPLPTPASDIDRVTAHFVQPTPLSITPPIRIPLYRTVTEIRAVPHTASTMPPIPYIPAVTFTVAGLPPMTAAIQNPVLQPVIPGAMMIGALVPQATEKILQLSTLSPNAKEFVPSGNWMPSQLNRLAGNERNGTENSILNCSGYLNAQGDYISSCNLKENGDYMATHNGACGYQEKTDDQADENWRYAEMVETLQLVQSELVKHPAHFHHMMRCITLPLCQWLRSDLATQMIEIIICMATLQDNFGYIAAKMCVYVSDLDRSNIFRTKLIERCHSMCQNVGEVKKSSTFLGFVMFLAELYVQLKNERSQRFSEIGTGLLECLENLISEPVVCDNLKFLCNALKLAGFYLDTDLNSSMNQLMTHIQSVMTAIGLDNIDIRIHDQLQKLIDMRNNSWDNEGAASLESQEVDSTYNPNSNSATYCSGAVFYGPDGQVLTVEENQFLSENHDLAEHGQNENDEDSVKEDSSDSMDEEMQDAYEQFLMQMVPEAR